MGAHEQLDSNIAGHYTSVSEQQRLGTWSLERVRTWELLGRHLPPPPAVVLDLGGAAGVYALPLAARGYQVHLVDPVARHVEQARRASAAQPATPLASATVGDARQLDWPDVEQRLADPARRERVLAAIRRVETEPSLLGASSHLLAVASR